MTYFYLLAQGHRWSEVVEGPFQGKASLKIAAIRLIESCHTSEGAVIASIMVAAANKKVGSNKSLRNDWIIASNALSASADSDIKLALDVFAARGGEV